MKERKRSNTFDGREEPSTGFSKAGDTRSSIGEEIKTGKGEGKSSWDTNITWVGLLGSFRGIEF